ncbi:MAG: hypothetical protein HYT29_02045 [Parcubacteria group bacterium]|nr:hypothetical protein [Parcubacteria group bacterium]
MNKQLQNDLAQSKANADKVFSTMSGEQKTQLEKNWDVEHAYYSSVLEGSKMDRKTFEEIGKSVE